MQHNNNADYQWVTHWIENGPSAMGLKEAEAFSKNIQGQTTRSQIRQVFSKLKRIESKGINQESQKIEFLMLKPYLAYAASRDRLKMDTIKTILTKGIDNVYEHKEDNIKYYFDNFCKLFEAILAYHRAYGGN